MGKGKGNKGDVCRALYRVEVRDVGKGLQPLRCREHTPAAHGTRNFYSPVAESWSDDRLSSIGSRESLLIGRRNTDSPTRTSTALTSLSLPGYTVTILAIFHCCGGRFLSSSRTTCPGTTF